MDEAAYRQLVARAEFGRAKAVLEIGGGTGRLAARLLSTVLPTDATYTVTEYSRGLHRRTAAALAAFGPRAAPVLVTPAAPYPFAGPFDRVVSTYVLCMLPDHAVRRHLDEAHRMLADGGTLCVCVTSRVRSRWSRALMGTWDLAHRVWPAAVGGSRPIDLTAHLSPIRWDAVTADVVSTCGFASQVVTCRKVPAAGK